MATFNKFNSFSEAIAEKVHNLGTDTLKVMLTNTAPVATNAIKTDITEITAGNGYTAGGNTSTQTTSSQTSGTYKLVLADPTAWTAVTSSMATFRYAVLYNDTATNKELIGWWDYGSAVTLAVGDSFTVDFDPTTGVLTLV
jgi:hypothetical protein